MFEEFLGLPMHVLVVHAPVVLLPLLALAALAYGLVPRVRSYVGWVAVTLAVVAPSATMLAKLSGDAYRDRLYGTGELDPELPVQVHAGLGDSAMWSALGLGAVTLVLAAVRRGTETSGGLWRAVAWVLTAVLVVLAALALYYVIRVGHTGSEMTHGGRLPG